LISAGFIVALAGVVAVAAWPTSLGAPGPTSLVLYAPFTAEGHVASDTQISATVAGRCWSSSVSRRSDAYRCVTTTSYLQDPCFADESGHAAFVLCPSRFLPPRKVVKITLAGRLAAANSRSGDPMQGLPWTVRLSDGRWCGVLLGATGVVAGMRINYGCNGGGTLIGTPRRSLRTWTILFSESSQSSKFRAVPIAAAWW
jgi:hypothetical protein